MHDSMNQKHGNEEGNKGNSPRAPKLGEEDSKAVGHGLWRMDTPAKGSATLRERSSAIENKRMD